MCQCANSFCFSESGNSLDKNMSTSKHSDNEFFYEFILSDYMFFHTLSDMDECFMNMSEGRGEHSEGNR